MSAARRGQAGWIDPAARPYRMGVGIVLIKPGGLVFAGQRLDNYHEAWQMPQGGIDRGEAPRDAVLRELEEETGVKPALAELIAESRDWLRYDLPDELVDSVWRGRFRGQEQKWFAARFLGEDADIDVRTPHPEFVRWRWLAPHELLASIVPFKRALYEAVFKEFADCLS